MQTKLLLLILLIAIPCGNTTVKNASAISIRPTTFANEDGQRDPAVEFAKAITRMDYNLAQKFVEGYVEIPDIRENSRIKQYQLVPSPKAGVKILIAHFDDEVLKGERLAFIWELTVHGKSITKIRVLFDGSNPLVDEARLINEYQSKNRRHVLIPAEFPFREVTRFDGCIEHGSSLVLTYWNDKVNGFFRERVSPISMELERYKGKSDVYYTLKDGTKALYRTKFEFGYELRFQKNGLHYTLTIGNKKSLMVKYTPETLMRIANSMVFPTRVVKGYNL